MAITWLIKKNTDTPVTLADAGVTGCVLSLKSNGVDSLTFTQSNDWVAAPAWPFASKVALIRRDSAASPADRCVFVGTVEMTPRQAEGGGPQAITYTALGPAYALQLCDYSQEWAYTADDGTPSAIYEPTVVLGEDNNGDRLASGAVINHVASYAVSRGVPIDIGTIAVGVTVPLDERVNIKCWDAIVAMLRYTPDYVLWWDYDHTVDGAYVPSLNVTAPAAMTAVSRALVNGAATGAAFTPRYDIRVPGILIVYRWTGDWDGRTVKSRRTDTAGTYDDPRRVALVYDLDGVHASFITQEVEVEDYPADWFTPAGKLFMAARLPQLASIPDADWELTSVERSGEELYSSRLVSGAVPEWTGKHTETETFTAEVVYTVKSSTSGNILETAKKRLTFTTVSTDAVSKTYRRMVSWLSAEPVPSGMAADLFTSWNRLHYDGGITFHGQECDVGLGLGQLLSCTGGLAEWASMAAVIQDVTHDIGAGTTTVRTGTCGRLEADNLMAIYRAARGRRYSYLRLGRDNPDATAASPVDGGGLTPNDSADGGTPPMLRTRFAVEATNPETEVTHRIDLAPELLAHANPADEVTRTLQPVELPVVVDASTSAITVQKAQVLACSPYGSPSVIPVGGGSAEVDPDGPIEDGTGGLTLKAHATMGLTNDLNLYAYFPASGLWRWIHTLPYGGLKSTVLDNQTLETVLAVEGAPTNGSSLGASPKIWGWSGSAYQFFSVLVLDITSS